MPGKTQTMSNMSYCRFENTARDLRDCAEHICDKLTGDHEPAARLSLIETCMQILEAVGFNIDMHQAPVIIEDEDETED
jgi:hypothetical protein